MAYSNNNKGMLHILVLLLAGCGYHAAPQGAVIYCFLLVVTSNALGF